MFVGCFVFATQIYNILLLPYVWAASQHGYPLPHLVFTEPLGFLITKIKLAAFGAAFLAFPVIATQIYKFVAPGLYKKEQRAFLPYLGRDADPFPDRRGRRVLSRHAGA